MTTRAVLPDGTVLEFAEGVDPQVIDYVVKKQLGVITDEAPLPEKSDSISQGVVLGAREPLDILAARLEQSQLPGVAGINRLGAALGLPSATETLAQTDIERGRNTSTVGQVIGNVGGTAAMLPVRAVTAPATMAQAAIGGGLSSALLSRAKEVPEFLSDVGSGAAFGGAMQPAANLVGNIIAPQASNAVKTLLQDNIYPTIGMMAREGNTLAGRGISLLEEAATSLPAVGDLIQLAREGTINEYGQAALNRAAKAIGKTVPKELSGEEAVGWVKNELSNAYNNLVPSLNFSVTSRFVNDAGDVLKSLNIPSSRTELISDWNAIFKDNIANLMDANGEINGRNLQAAVSNLGDLGSTMMRATDAFERRVGVGVMKLRGKLLDNLAAQNPAKAKELKNLNKGWAQEIRLQKATAGAGGVLTPQSLDRAVASFAKGQRQGPLADLARAGRIIPSRLPDSGTAGRMLRNSAILGAVGSLGAVGNEIAQNFGYEGVDISPSQLSAIALIAAPYTPAGRKAIAKILGRTPSKPAQMLGTAWRGAVSPATSSALISQPEQGLGNRPSMLTPEQQALVNIYAGGK